MPVRPTLSELIATVRGMVRDTSNAPLFDDATVAIALDSRREDVRALELVAQETIQSGGAVAYLDYYAPSVGAWEIGAVLQDANYATLTPASAENLLGSWHFEASQPTPVYATGRVYDLNAVAADLLEMRLSQQAGAMDFSVDGLSVSRGNQLSALRQAIGGFRARQKVGVIRMARGDER